MSISSPPIAAPSFVIPSLDLLGGRAVRLLRGDFRAVTDYGDPMRILDGWELEPGSLIHVVDLEGSRQGHPAEVEMVARIAARGLAVQVGGGVRAPEDAARWIEAG
ncbi:MAG TPA: HisA/HisF-related TIM barrel protein, partial [Thermoanaerobaculia bacterium]|nr:HisA/HisF-related TIM barrel protein [Thermoanaerobaculia bacterium]